MTRTSRRDALRLLAFSLGAASLVGSLGCSRSKPKRVAVERVVSLTPSTTEALFAIGAGKIVVGRSRYCNFPPEVEKLPAVGGFVDPNLETILSLRPDLVVGARGPAGRSIADILSERGLATYFPPSEHIREIEEMITGLGERTGFAAGANELLAKLRTELGAIDAKLAHVSRPRALLLFGMEPIVAAGPGSFGSEILERAGATNIVKEGGSYPTLSMERVLMLNPEVILNAAVLESHGAQVIDPARPGWGKLPAVQQGRVFGLNSDTVFRPGPRVTEGLKLLANAIHPELSW